MTAEELFKLKVLPKVRKTETCWFFMGARHSAGYGVFRQDKKLYYCHRVAYEAVKGPIMEDKFITHVCNNTACCNPEHLTAGTQSENMRYMGRCGRKPVSSSGIQGVYFHKLRNVWEARTARPSSETLYRGPDYSQAVAARLSWEKTTQYRVWDPLAKGAA